MTVGWPLLLSAAVGFALFVYLIVVLLRAESF